VPILPAFLLFKAIKSNANLSGPFKGMTVKLGGAFAGYFLVLLLMSQLVPFIEEGPQDYVLFGKVRLAADTLADPRQWYTRASISVRPSRSEVKSNGQLVVHFPFDPEVDPPSIIVDVQQCGSALIPVDTSATRVGAEDFDLSFMPRQHRVVAGKTILVEPPPGLTAAQRDTADVVCGIVKP
jgi:hypothetical protein